LCLCDEMSLLRGLCLSLSHGCGRRVALCRCVRAALALTSQLCVSKAPPASLIPPVPSTLASLLSRQRVVVQQGTLELIAPQFFHTFIRCNCCLKLKLLLFLLFKTHFMYMYLSFGCVGHRVPMWMAVNELSSCLPLCCDTEATNQRTMELYTPSRAKNVLKRKKNQLSKRAFVLSCKPTTNRVCRNKAQHTSQMPSSRPRQQHQD
jgi:hypothetical protein